MQMASITFDKLAYTHTLRAAGFSEQQAEACAHALDNALRDSVATKADVQEARRDLSADVTALETRITQEFSAVRAEMAAMKSELKQDIANQKADLLKWVVPLLLGQAALIAAMVKLL